MEVCEPDPRPGGPARLPRVRATAAALPAARAPRSAASGRSAPSATAARTPARSGSGRQADHKSAAVAGVVVALATSFMEAVTTVASRPCRRSQSSPAPSGWLGQNLVRALAPERERVRCLVPTTDDGAAARARRPERRGRSSATSATRRALDRLFDGVGRRDACSTPPAVIHPAGQDARVLRRERRRHAARARPGPPGRRRPLRARVVELAVRRQRHARPTGSPRTRRTTRTWATGSRSSRPSSSCSAATSAATSRPSIVRPPWFYGPYQPARQTQFFAAIRRGPLPARRRRHAAALDGVHRQPRRTGCCAPRSAAAAPGRAYWIADAEPYELREILDTRARRARGRGPRRSPRRPAAPARVVAASVGGGARRACCRAAAATCRPVHVLGELKDTIACDISRARDGARLRPADRRCSRACGRASAGASSAATRDSDGAHASWSPAAAATSARRSSTRRSPAATTCGSSTSTRRPSRRRRRVRRRRRPRPRRAARRVRRRRRRAPQRRPGAAGHGPRAVLVGERGRHRQRARSPRATPASARSCTRRRARSSASPSRTRSPRTRPAARSRPTAGPSSQAELLCREAVADRARRHDRAAPHDPRPRPARDHGHPVRVRGRRRARCSCSGAGDNRYQFVHADDLADACLRAADRPGPDGLQRRRHRVRHDARDAAGARRPRRAPARGCGRCRSAPAALAMRGARRRSGWRRSRRTTGCCTASRCGSTPPRRGPSSAGSPRTRTRRWSSSPTSGSSPTATSSRPTAGSHHQSPVRLGAPPAAQAAPITSLVR